MNFDISNFKAMVPAAFTIFGALGESRGNLQMGEQSIIAGQRTPHSHACMPPIELPIIAAESMPIPSMNRRTGAVLHNRSLQRRD